MTDNESGVDYSVYAREGEIKKTKRTFKPLAPTRKQTLKSEATNQERFQGHLKDSTHGSVPRQVHGKPVSLPITEQPPLPGLSEDVPSDIAVTKRDSTKNLDPELTYIMESIDTQEEPIPPTRTKTLRFMHARSDGILKQAQKKSKK